jgi:hypothetical protein
VAIASSSPTLGTNFDRIGFLTPAISLPADRFASDPAAVVVMERDGARAGAIAGAGAEGGKNPACVEVVPTDKPICMVAVVFFFFFGGVSFTAVFFSFKKPAAMAPAAAACCTTDSSGLGFFTLGTGFGNDVAMVGTCSGKSSSSEIMSSSSSATALGAAGFIGLMPGEEPMKERATKCIAFT